MGIKGRMGLPQRIARLSLFGPAESSTASLYAVVVPHPNEERFDAEIVDAKGNCYLQLTGYHTVEVPNIIDAGKAKALQAAMSLEPVAA